LKSFANVLSPPSKHTARTPNDPEPVIRSQGYERSTERVAAFALPVLQQLAREKTSGFDEGLASEIWLIRKYR